MSQTILLLGINKKEEYPKYITVQAPNCCGQIALIIDKEKYTQQMLYEMPSIIINIYTLQGGKHSLYSSRQLQIDISKENISCILSDIPKSCILAIMPQFDDKAIESHNNSIHLDDMPELWTTPTEEFPATVVFMDSITATS